MPHTFNPANCARLESPERLALLERNGFAVSDLRPVTWANDLVVERPAPAGQATAG